MPIKHIDITEFREEGYLQEANRLFFHPLGLALETTVCDNCEGTGEEPGTNNHCQGLARQGQLGELEGGCDGRGEWISGVWDYRDDPEGVVMDGSLIDDPVFAEKANRVRKYWRDRESARREALGFFVQDIYDRPPPA